MAAGEHAGRLSSTQVLHRGAWRYRRLLGRCSRWEPRPHSGRDGRTALSCPRCLVPVPLSPRGFSLASVLGECLQERTRDPPVPTLPQSCWEPQSEAGLGAVPELCPRSSLEGLRYCTAWSEQGLRGEAARQNI